MTGSANADRPYRVGRVWGGETHWRLFAVADYAYLRWAIARLEEAELRCIPHPTDPSLGNYGVYPLDAAYHTALSAWKAGESVE